MIKSVIFDMDGVLIDSEPHHTQAVADVLQNIGFDPKDILEKYRVSARSYEHTWADLIRELGIVKPLDEITQMQYDYSYEFFETLDLEEIKGASDCMMKLKDAGYTIAVGSSAPVRLIRIILEKLDVMKYLSTYCGVDYVKRPKPSPDIYKWIADDLKLYPSECVVIEDSPTGISAAKAAGMKCIALYGTVYSKEKLAAADAIADNFEEAAKLVMNL